MRTSLARWSALSAMIGYVERCLEANCRLDAKVPEDRGSTFCSRIDAADYRVQKELNRLTCELLERDLERKKRRAA
jgi:hypothetical protein